MSAAARGGLASRVAPESADIEACYRATDLAWRLKQIPHGATCRGAFFNMLDDRAATLSEETQREYRRFFPVHRLSAFRMYSLRDYLTRIVLLSQIHYGEHQIHAGLRELQSGAFDAWAGTLLGRAALAVVSPDLLSVLRVLERAYASQTVVSHARFSVESADARTIITRFKQEHVYIESAMVGALEGVARTCRERVEVRAELDGPFDGVVRIRRLGSEEDTA
ncbi:DUF2378 family protein [Sandaracinus amylolyticus]|uniref:Uncharacterized protein n=1 Tax=Sandaracinus amylolyticus TaxID=927083 RepID=A0A0F6W2X8_9BACT|nr:DUF2378 family protein [Sandaracinus amylolyticus]AKF05965.1 hypothetical protein DB32_003114 [Sandaracinus amylolyticus]